MPGRRSRRRARPAQRRDSDAIRARLDRGGKVVVVGAGWIGSRGRRRPPASAGCDVTVIEPASVPLERVLGAELGAVYRDVHVDHGVELLLGTGVDAFEGDGAVERVRASDGRLFECRLRRRRDRRRAAHRARRRGPALAVDNGIVSDRAPRDQRARDLRRRRRRAARPPLLRPTSGRALGQRPAPGPGGRAQHARPRARPTTTLPYFFSDQYDVGMEYTGQATAGSRLVVSAATPRRGSSSRSGSTAAGSSPG